MQEGLQGNHELLSLHVAKMQWIKRTQMKKKHMDSKRHKHNPNFRPEAKSCPKDECLALSQDQRDAVTKL